MMTALCERPAPAAFDLHPRSGAIDAGVRLPNINDAFKGKAPDLGAREHGAPAPLYGPRPEGVDESSRDWPPRR